MESKTIIDRLNNIDLLNKDLNGEWDIVVNDFPYFSIARWFKYGQDFFQNKGNLPLVSLYKSEPLEFARFCQQLNQTKLNSLSTLINESIISETRNTDSEIINSQHSNKDEIHYEKLNSLKEEINVDHKAEDNKIENLLDSSDQNAKVENGSDDILALIQDLPNVSPFEISDQSEMDEIIIEEFTQSNNHDDSPLSFIDPDKESSLMVMMSFTDWLNHFKSKNESEKEEVKEKKALKTAWQKEKLAEAADEELDEIPEPIFKQAMDSISMESDLMSESLAEILSNQGKKDKAIAMYKKLSLRNPEKSTYFADRINELNSNLE